MAKLIMIVEVNTDPTKVDPHEVAEEMVNYGGAGELIAGAWEGTASLSAILELEEIR